MKAFSSLAFIGVLALTPLGSHASHVIVRAEGTVDTVWDADGLLPFSVNGGERMSISYLIDDAITPLDEYPSIPNRARYHGTVLSMTITVGDHSLIIEPPGPLASYMSADNDLTVGDRLADSWGMGAQTHLSPPASPERMFSGDVFLYVETRGSGYPPGLVSSEAFQPYPFGGWLEALEAGYGGASLGVSVSSAGLISSSISAPITSLTVTPVPIPAALCLLLSGLGLLFPAVGVARRGTGRRR